MLRLAAPRHASEMTKGGFACPSLLERLNRDYQNPAHPILLRPSIAHNAKRGTGILTCWPLSTPFGLDLGPTNPGRNSLPQETLDFR